MGKISNVIFIVYQPVSTKFKNDFFTERLYKENYIIECWNVSKLLNKEPVIINDINIKQIKVHNRQQLENFIQQKKTTSVFIFDLTYTARTYNIFKIFSSFDCITISFARGSLPAPLASKTFLQKFKSKFKAFLNVAYVITTIKNQLAIAAKKNGKIKSYTIIFYAGKEGVASIGYGYKYGLEKSKLIPINSFDYDKYLLIKDKTVNKIASSYCVFLDVFLPHHPDFDLLKLPKVNADEYYQSLNNFFDFIEATYNVKVVIAAHPKADYSNTNAYAGRTVIKDKTAELVKHARFVLAHLSTSISLAVLFKKPVIFIYTENMKEIYRFMQYPVIIYFSQLLKATLVNTDENFKNITINEVDDEAYAQYKYNYLTNRESEQFLSEDIFIKQLQLLEYSGNN